jgi:serine/threonine-protein kinase
MSGPPQTARSEATAVRHIPDLVGAMPQQQQQSSGGSKVGIILSVVALVAVIGIGVFMMLPKKGTLKIDITAKGGGAVDKAEIFVDGQKKCDITPCIVADLDPGSRTVKVIIPGAGPVDPVTATVEAGKEVPVAIIIDSGAGAAPTASAPVAANNATGIKILAATPNTKVFLDGTEKGSLPIDLTDVKPGSHKLKFEGGDRYEKLEQSVDVEAGKLKEIGPIKLKVLKGQIILSLVTEGAEVKLINSKKTEKKIPEKEWKSQPVKIDLDPTEGWKLVASKKGMDDFTVDLGFDDGNAEKEIRIDLAAPKAAAGSAADGAASGSAAGRSGHENGK